MVDEVVMEAQIEARYVVIDETEYWCLEPEDMRHVEKIETVYVYDIGQVTYLCELTPSYYLWPCETRVVYFHGTKDRDVERIDEIVNANADHQHMYMHCRSVESLPGYHLGVTEIDEDTYMDRMNELIARHNSNCMI